MDLNEIQCFVRVAQQKSMTKAARLLGMPKSTVSRKVSSLEKRLATTLLHRTTRAIKLTEAGEAYYRRMATALAEMEHAEEDLQASRERIAGTVRLTAPVEFGVGAFMETLRRFQDRYRDVSLELLLTERLVDFIAEGVDVGVRIGELRDSTMISRRLGAIAGAIVASPAYIARHGAPRRPEDLANHALLGFTPSGWLLNWVLRRGSSRRTIKVASRFSTNNIVALKTAALAAQGLATLPLFLIRDEIESGALKVVLSEWQSFGAPVNVVFPGQRYLAPRTRALINFLVDEMSLDSAPRL